MGKEFRRKLNSEESMNTPPIGTLLDVGLRFPMWCPIHNFTFWERFVSRWPWFDPDTAHLVVCSLTQDHEVMGWHVAGTGPRCGTRPRWSEVFRPALQLEPVNLLLLHNNPTGSLRPSVENLRMTSGALAAAGEFGLEVVDHILFGNGSLSLRWYVEKGIGIETADERSEADKLRTAWHRQREREEANGE